MYQRILVPVDGSDTANAGLAEAIKLAKLTGAQLRLVHVIDEMPFIMNAGSYGAMTGDLITMMKEGGELILAAAKKMVEAEGLPVDSVMFDSLNGRLSERIADEAMQWDADLIVLGTHGRHGVGRMLLGSGAEQILRSSNVPVLLIRAVDAVPAALPTTLPKALSQEIA
ncbi:MAG: universal stress protein [Rhizobacter sp.]